MIIWDQRSALIDYSVSAAEVFAHQLTQSIYSDFIFAGLKKNSALKPMETGSPEHIQLDKIAGAYFVDYRDIVKFKIYDPEGRTIYSTDDENIGEINKSEMLAKALKGNTTSKLIMQNKEALYDSAGKERRYKVDLMSIYVPIYKNIYNPLESEIAGAFEIYRDVNGLFEITGKNLYSIPLKILLSMGILFISWQIAIKKADRIIRRQSRKIDKHNAELESARKAIKESTDKVIEHESFNLRLMSAKLLKCWEIKNCRHAECPCYESENLRCWQVAGTFCDGKAQGMFENKYGDCGKCEVYQHAFTDRISAIVESFNNMMTLLENKHTEVTQLNEKLNRLVDIDPLTQTRNRRSFHQHMENIHLMALRYNHDYSIIICDVDNFKLYNDTYGPQKRDYVLVNIVNTMKAAVRKTDGIFRWGGEEFVIILPQQNIMTALKVAENLRSAIEQLHIEHKKNKHLIVTISCGVCSNAAGHLSWADVLKNADNALYKAKMAGRNCVCAAPDTDYKT